MEPGTLVVGGVETEIADRAIGSTQLYAGLLFFAFNFAAMNLAAKRLEWLALQRITFVVLPFASGAGFLMYGWIEGLGMPVLNGNVMAGAVVAMSALYSSRMLLENYRDREWQKTVSIALLVWGLLWWFGTGTLEALDRAHPANNQYFMLLFYSANFIAMTVAAKRYRWAEMSRATQAILPLSLFMAYTYLAKHGHLFVGVWSLAWIAAIAAYVWTLYARKSERNRDESFMHGAGAVFLAAILTHEVYWQVDQVVANDVWPISAGLLVLVAAAFAYSSKKARSVWPFSDNAIVYHQVASGLIVMNLFLLIIVCIESSGSTAPLPYIPILNPFDMLSIIALAAAWLVAQATPADSAWHGTAKSRNLLKVLGGLAFVLSTYAVLRAVHHFTGVDWERHALMGSVSVQSTLTIYWALLSLAAMEVGQRKGSRGLWMVGAALMGVVVAKLFVVDLGNSGTVARIVSFLGVGVMLLVVGYFSPVPPKKSDSS